MIQGLTQEAWQQAMQQAAASSDLAKRGKQEQENEKLKAYLAGQGKKQEADLDIETLKKLQEAAPSDASSIAYGKAHIGADPTSKLFAQMHRNEVTQGQRIYGEAQKTIKPIDTQVSTLHQMHQLLDDPNSVDQKQLGANFARLTEGQGQRLLQSLVHTMGAPASVAGNSQDFANWLTGSAKSGLTADQRNAMRQNLFKHQAEISGQLQDAKGQFSQAAPIIAPDLTPDKHAAVIGAATQHSDRLMQDLDQRRQVFEKQQGSAVVPQQMPAQQAQPTGMVDKAMSGLGNFLSPKQAAPQPAQPQMSFDEFKKRKAAGQL